MAFSTSLVERDSLWTGWKAAQVVHGFPCQFEEDSNRYKIWGYDGPEVYTCVIFKGAVPEHLLSAGYTQQQNDADKANFEVAFKAAGNKALAPRTSDGRPRLSAEKSDGSKKTVVSHDWTDPTTWAEGSVRVVDEVASDGGAHTVYALAHPNVIDTYHGKVSQEDFLKDAGGFNYRVAVKVNGVTKAEQDPHFGAGGDFTVDYVNGEVTFLSALQANDVVLVTYHYAVSSVFTIKPGAGKGLKILFAECNFSDDVEMTDSVVFQPYGFVDVFAPQLLQANGGPLAPGTKIPLGDPMVYKSMTDFQNEAVKSYPAYPPLGGNGWRGSHTAILPLDWDYVSSTLIRSDYGMEVRISLQHDVPFGGWCATATFYCISE